MAKKKEKESKKEIIKDIKIIVNLFKSIFLANLTKDMLFWSFVNLHKIWYNINMQQVTKNYLLGQLPGKEEHYGKKTFW